MPRQRLDISATPDNLFTPTVKPHAETKYRILHYYDSLFSTGIKKKFAHRVYIDLFSGPGKARLGKNGRIVYTSPLLAMNIPDQFTQYFFCDEDEGSLQALESRVASHFNGLRPVYIPGDCNTNVAEIINKLPQPSRENKVLIFCFIDPYNLKFKFETICQLNAFRVDFLILLATDMDGARNRNTYERSSNPRIDEFLRDKDWRPRWNQTKQKQESSFSAFLLNSFADKMVDLKYKDESRSTMVHVRSDQQKLPLYRLAFFSKDDLGYDFWSKVRTYTINPEFTFQ